MCEFYPYMFVIIFLKKFYKVNTIFVSDIQTYSKSKSKNHNHHSVSVLHLFSCEGLLLVKLTGHVCL